MSNINEAIAEITSANHDNAEHGERGIRILRDFQHLEYGTKLYAHPAQCLHQIQEPAAAEQAAWHAGLDEGRAQAAPAAVAVPNGGTPGLWSVRKREVDGELRDCFVTAPDCQGLPYDAEILGDDEYRDDNGIARKLADCELIVAAVNAYRAALAATPAAAPVVLPEPAATAVDVFSDGKDIQVNWCEKPPAHGTKLYTEQQLRALLATATGLPAQVVEDGK